MDSGISNVSEILLKDGFMSFNVNSINRWPVAAQDGVVGSMIVEKGNGRKTKGPAHEHEKTLAKNL